MKLNREGFITDYLISGVVETEFQDNHRDTDQLKYEKYLRTVIANEEDEKPKESIGMGKKSELGKKWEYYYSYENWFVDKSAFYPLMRKIEFYAVTYLETDKECKLDAILWTYGACEIWVNDKLVCRVKEPVYKPIRKHEIVLPLLVGKNEVFIRFQNLGVRDTRNIFGIQIVNKETNIKVSLPDWEKSENLVEMGEILNSLSITEGKLCVKEQNLCTLQLQYDSKTDDYRKQKDRYEIVDITGMTEVMLKKGIASLIILAQKDDHILRRRLEVTEEIQPTYHPCETHKASLEYSFEQIANVSQMLRGNMERFSMYPLLARKALGCSRVDDENEVYNDLEHMENRRDCSDFLSCALIRYCKLYPMNEKMKMRTKEVLLNYRYWMDEEGSDGMCFWSENHSLMFYISAYFAGQMYPEDIFKRSGKKGKELSEAARVRLMDWLEDVLEFGFEEFQSGGYTPITFNALLNLVDFGDDELSELAKKTEDKILMLLATHSFKGVVISPQGRVYREVLYPFAQGVQQLLYMIDSKVPYYFSEWVSTLATSSYTFPNGLNRLMDGDIATEYIMGNALIKLYKTKEYIVTSVQSPRVDSERKYWENISFDKDVDQGSFKYCKSLNERFHGTSKFEPGVYGYQQHMWYAAIDKDTAVFTNHPGGTCDETSTRPGYWFGNGEMPAVRQQEGLIGIVYNISEEHPIVFTHMYFPEKRFENIQERGMWKFGKKGKGYIGIWCSRGLLKHNDQLFDCELRAYGSQTAYLCQCGGESEYGDFKTFQAYCLDMEPEFDGTVLRTTAGFELKYARYSNITQYV